MSRLLLIVAWAVALVLALGLGMSVWSVADCKSDGGVPVRSATGGVVCIDAKAVK